MSRITNFPEGRLTISVVTLALILLTVSTTPLLAQLAPPAKTTWGEDHDGDGDDDHFFEDLDGDGKVDICRIDMDEDGNAEERWIDDDDDGDWDTQQKNPNDDAKWDSGRTDTNDNGKSEMGWTDTDGDGAIDFDEIFPVTEPMPAGPTPNSPPTPGSMACVLPECDFPFAPEGLGGYLPFAHYTFHQPAASLAEGYFSSIGPCGQLAGWGQVAGIGIPALSTGGTIETFPSLGTPAFSFSVNSGNAMVGMYGGPSGFLPYFLPPGEGMIELLTLGGDNGQAYDINAGATHIVGSTTAEPGFAPFQPTVWQVFGGPGGYEPVPFALPTLSSSGGNANAVSDFGWIAGSLVDSFGDGRAILWIGEPGAYDIVDLGPGVAYDINDHGVVVGSVEISDGTTRGFVYAQGELAILRSPIDCSDCSHRATSINERGEMVGWIEFASGDTAPAYWPGPEGLPVLLTDRIDPEIALAYEITAADSINDAGQILVGGYLGTEPLTFVLTPAGLNGPDSNFDAIPDSCQSGIEPFFRGDLNGDLSLDIADPVTLLSGLFGGGAYPTCEDAADSNDDGTLDIADAIYLLSHLFLAGPTPSVISECGYDTTPDTLTCELSGSCSAADVAGAASGLATEPCPGGTLILSGGHAECIGGTWHNVTEETYACPDGTLQVVRISSVDTGQPCP